MDDDELRGRLTHAADEFPVRGWPVDVHRRVARRRVTTGLSVAVGVVAAAGVAVAVTMLTGGSSGPDRAVSPPLRTDAGYVGSSWLLTSVADGADTTAIPADVGARMDLLADGRILVDNGVNTLSGRFTTSDDGFEVRDVGSTFVVYGGSDPHRLAAQAGLNTLAYGNRDGDTPSAPARDTVLSAGGSGLVVQAGTIRLTFDRTGTASAGPDRPTASGTPS